ncbi:MULTISPECIES: hypothetical protein [Rhizobium/Agrobacterium group]|uniref:hypothetical protein n=1 Tax=Rhizobium/Agrobacterium group TaxID=227290 RepID=UPI00107F231B|nr:MULTISPECIES: hypothetical protein [Rhizobium/Agrobacterium group]MBB4402544.1 hypothetical protein [Agrobacterium radiobacter]MBB5588698.1 hypothetical protein [Agrobacterium radiobacter]TGE89176.1 hypothetical protein C9418_12550 [Rhizobium sp. SEMIA 4032]
MKTYEVLRQHFGDKMYMSGDTREAAQGEVQHLINNGVLRETKAKAAPAPSNKAEKAAPKNKSV